jgi:predicted DNA-binding protein with PD1-like motif
MIVADSEGNCFGGHLMKGCKVSVTLEVVMFEMDGELRRARDTKTGLNLLSLGRAGSSVQ